MVGFGLVTEFFFGAFFFTGANRPLFSIMPPCGSIFLKDSGCRRQIF